MKKFDALILIGPQGSGKGTQASMLIEKLHAQYLEAGALLRAEAQNDTELGREVKHFTDNGLLITDETWQKVVEAKLATFDPAAPVIIDGSPRRLSQAHLLLDYLKAHGRSAIVTIFISLPREVSIYRLQNRKVCVSCSMPNLHPTGDPEKDCLRCGGKLVVRHDDTDMAAIDKRLELYERDTVPVLDYLKETTEFHEVDGRPSVEKVSKKIDGILEIQPIQPRY